MEKSFSESYAAAGVDITAGYKAVELMKTHIKRTLTAGAMSDIGGFGGLFELDLTGISKPVLVSGTDGIGTKLKLAFIMDKHDTVGIDCVAMCANDIICCGAKPLLFLDYIACGKNVPERIAEIVSGIAEGCVQSNAALIGGEPAEMPGFYPVDEYDLAGAIAANTTLPVVGIPVKSSTLDGLDALLSTVQMPAGIPVATVAIDGAANAALLCVEILAASDDELAQKLDDARAKAAQTVLEKNAKIEEKYNK